MTLIFAACDTTTDVQRKLRKLDDLVRPSHSGVNPSKLSDETLCLLATNPFDRSLWADKYNDPGGRYQLEAKKRGLCIKN